MKNLMKAIAFATVMCMLLSVTAFAASEANMAGDGTASVTIIIDDAAASTPIALVVAKSTVESATGLDESNILYIDQAETDEYGAVTFNSVDTKGEKAVNVFVGYEGVSAAIKLVAAKVDLGPGDKVVIEDVKFYQTADIDKDVEGVEATDVESGSGATGTATITVDEGRKIAGINWAIGHSASDGSDVKRAYVKANADMLSVLTGNVQVRVGVAFSNGLKADPSTQRKITDLDLIVKTVKDDNSEELVIFTDEEADKDNENK